MTDVFYQSCLKGKSFEMDPKAQQGGIAQVKRPLMNDIHAHWKS